MGQFKFSNEQADHNHDPNTTKSLSCEMFMVENTENMAADVHGCTVNVAALVIWKREVAEMKRKRVCSSFLVPQLAKNN